MQDRLLYPDITADEIEYLLNDSDAVCLVAQDQSRWTRVS
jgi:long-chain acyl-CoA synthetase